MNRALGFRSGRLRLTAPPINANFYAGKLSWSPWLRLWLSFEGRTGETRATEFVVNGIGALLESRVHDAGVDSLAQLGAVEMHVSLLEL